MRQRTRDAVRGHIAAAAVVMFYEQGFDETTVDQIAAAVGISPRSFFRYFPTKEDVVVGDPMVYGELVRERLTAVAASRPLWDALRAAFDPVVAVTDADPEGTLQVSRVIVRTPALRAKSVQKHLAWTALLVPVVADNLTGAHEGREFHAHAATLGALTCLDVATAEWVHRDGATTFGRVLDETFALLKPTGLAV